MNNFYQIIINKNRGWRGLAEVLVRNEMHENQLKMVFSFSQQMWLDLIVLHKIVVQDQDNYYVIYFEPITTSLPRADQQRSVLIKNFAGRITTVNSYKKAEWRNAEANDWNAIYHFIKNRNNHTTSDWNCIGIRVVPTI